MRIFKDFSEARGEIKRDLKEMGVRVTGKKMQDKEGAFPTLELENYGYTVLEPLKNIGQLNPTPVWASAEWSDRRLGITGCSLNPGGAWTTREDMDWSQYLEFDGKPLPNEMKLEDAQRANIDAAQDPVRFAYTYGERFALNDQVWKIIRELRDNPYSRQLYICMWDPHTDPDRLGKRRVPCSIGWHFIFRGEQLNVTYTMRSCDFFTHWDNDCWLTLKLLELVAIKANITPGQFSQFINSFHVYESDVANVF